MTVIVWLMERPTFATVQMAFRVITAKSPHVHLVPVTTVVNVLLTKLRIPVHVLMVFMVQHVI